VRAGLGVGLLAEMALDPREDADLRALAAPAAIPECTTWAVLPRERVLRDYALELLKGLAPQLDTRDVKRAVAGHDDPRWPPPPPWGQRG
jgi:LysR family cys regulon transcriptional activator